MQTCKYMHIGNPSFFQKANEIFLNCTRHNGAKKNCICRYNAGFLKRQEKGFSIVRNKNLTAFTPGLHFPD